jgi:hypothetical protein
MAEWIDAAPIIEPKWDTVAPLSEPRWNDVEPLATTPTTPHPAWWDFFKQAYGQGATGLAYDALTGGTYKPPTLQPQDFGEEAISAAGGFLSDLPAYMAAGPIGLVGGPLSPATIPATAMGGAGAFKSYMRGESPTDIATSGGRLASKSIINPECNWRFVLSICTGLLPTYDTREPT